MGIRWAVGRTYTQSVLGDMRCRDRKKRSTMYVSSGKPAREESMTESLTGGSVLLCCKTALPALETEAQGAGRTYRIQV